MATTTVSYYVDPTETPYVHGSVPLTDTQTLVCKIFGFGCLAILVIFMIGTFIYCTFMKPHKLRVAKRAADAVNRDLEKQNVARMWEEFLKNNPDFEIAEPLDAKKKRPRIHNPETCW